MSLSFNKEALFLNVTFLIFITQKGKVVISVLSGQENLRRLGTTESRSLRRVGTPLSASVGDHVAACFLGRKDTGVHAKGIFTGREHQKLMALCAWGAGPAQVAPASCRNSRCTWNKATCPPHRFSSSGQRWPEFTPQTKIPCDALRDTKTSLA